MKALVTGGGGFLGQYIVEQLRDRGDEVRTLSRASYPQLERLGVEQLRGDLRDSEITARACRGVDIVFHTAAVAGIWGPWRHYYGINTQGTLNVLAGCRQQGVHRLVFTSSPSVTFDGGDQCGVDESAAYPSQWLAHYPHTKALAEQAILAANGRDDLVTCALRPHLIWGPRDQHLIPRLIDRARNGKLRQVGDGTNLVDMVYVENAAAAHLQAADALEVGSPVAGRAIFISQGEPVNCWQWINQILARLICHPLRSPSRCPRLVELARQWRLPIPCALRIRSEPRMTRFLAAQLATSHYFDISAAQRDFGYEPAVSTAEGMRRLQDWLNLRD